jgi:hypothetical protein
MLLVVACVLVFSFALHAKVAVYQHSQPQASTASKMWTSGAKFEAPALTANLPVLWLLAVVAAMHLSKASWNLSLAPTKAREIRRQQYLHRFLRPPPR